MNYLSSLAVANWFLSQQPRSTVMRLQRLTYFSHCWCLAVYDLPLIDEFAIAYPYGPVFPTIYKSALNYGSDPVEDYLSDDFKSPPIISSEDPRIPLLLKIQEIYGNYTDHQLSRIANEENGPWQVTITNHPGRKHPCIDEETIKSFYRSRMQ